ncbi:hypothetical protein ACLMJK_000331 [Lecanora helva]
MPDTRYFTLNNEPPNGGVPPGTLFAQATNPPNANSSEVVHVDNGPPNGGAPPNAGASGPPPPGYYPFMIGPGYGVLPMAFPFAIPSPEPPKSSPPPRKPSAPAYEPPGQYVDGHLLGGKGWSYLGSTDKVVTIHLVHKGVRPCDSPGGYHPYEFHFTKHKAPVDMTVRKLIEQLGCPAGAHKGVTELILLGDDLFAAGDTFTQGGETSKRTLEEVGWTAERGEGKEVWLVAKR